MGKLPKERIPVVKKEEQRVMLQSLFLKTHQEALKHPKSYSGGGFEEGRARVILLSPLLNRSPSKTAD